MRKGTTLIELILVIGLLAIVGVVGLLNLTSRKSGTELFSSTQRIAALLREAQSRSVSREDSTSWGVHFDNSVNPYYSLFYGSTYSSSTERARYALPTSVKFTTSTVVEGGTANIFFSQLTGIPSGSTTISVYMIRLPSSSSTVTIDPSGAINY